VTVDAVERLAVLDDLAEERGIELQADATVGPLTTLRVGGPADRLVVVADVDELVAALELARDAGVPAGVLGKGSDLVVADDGIRGLLIRNRADGIVVDGTRMRAEGGAAMAALVKRATSEALAGIEFGISIPGSVGGAVWANAGAHGGEMKDVVRRVRAWSTADGALDLEPGDCDFAYRESRFKSTGEIVLEAELELGPGESETIAARVAELQAHRRATQPLAAQNAGSVFRNPPGDFAGRLIDEAGLKGYRIGSASVSTLHANFIVVDRGGRAADVRAVGDHVRAVVAERFGVELRYEIEFVGAWPADLDPPASRMAGVGP
jgi:UDP-N-acetylmuramate dehydrogenase